MLQYCGYCQHSLGLLQCGRRPQVLAASDLFTVDACAVSIGQAAVALSVANQQADLCRIRSRRVIASSDGCRLQWPAERTTVSPALWSYNNRQPHTIALYNWSVVGGNGGSTKLTAHRLYGLLAEPTSKFLFVTCAKR